MACREWTLHRKPCVEVLICAVICVFCSSVSRCDAADGCDKQTGPAGVKTCITSDGVYYDSQWATCLTNVYIQIKSGGRHTCFDPLATYCFYQCMVEEHDVELGNVTNDCRCVPNVTASEPSTETTTPALPSWCLSPPGTDCNWYDQCLQVKFDCDDSLNSYILHFAGRFCNLHRDDGSKFSSLGREWMGNVSKCMQASLVPLLRPWESPTCIGIRNRAFRSYIDCYRSPFLGAPSICDLPALDWWRVFWSMKASYVRAATATLIDLINTMKLCYNYQLSGPFKHIRVVKLLFRRIDIDLGYSGNTTQYKADDMFVGTVTSVIATILGWPSKGVGWFATASVNLPQLDSGDVNAIVVLADMYSLNVEYNLSHNVNLTAVVEELTQAVQDGRLNVFVTDWPVPLDIKHLYICADVNCNKITYNTTTTVTGAGSCSKTTSSLSAFIICIIFWCFSFL